MKHYILIEVREPSSRVPGEFTDAGRLRKAIHEFAQAANIDCADNIIREDNELLYDGRPVPYAEAVALFRKIMPIPGKPERLELDDL